MNCVMFRYYSDYDDDDDDVISIHDDDSEPETSSTEPAAKLSRLSNDVSMTTAAAAEPGNDDGELMMMEYWQANSYNVHLAADDTDDTQEMFANCAQLSSSACLVVHLKPGQMLYLPASWLYEVQTDRHVVMLCF